MCIFNRPGKQAFTVVNVNLSDSVREVLAVPGIFLYNYMHRRTLKSHFVGLFETSCRKVSG